jgi:hypothetical protein
VPFTAETVPPELAAILDEQAGIVHSATGSVRRCLADILNRYNELRDEAACVLAEEALAAEAGPEWARLIHEDNRVPPSTAFAVSADNIGVLDLATGRTAVVKRGGGDTRDARVRAVVKWYDATGNYVDGETREAERGAVLHTLLAAWSDRPLEATIELEPIGDGDGRR